MGEFDLILTLTGCLAVALVCGYVTYRLGLSPIVGYLVAGVLVGGHTPGFVANLGISEELAEIGVILLMFGVGLQFHVEELLGVRRVAVPGAVLRSLAATLLGLLIGWLFGWPWEASLVFGLALSIASTVVLIRVLVDHHDLQTQTGRVAVGWLVVEDLFTVLVLVLLPAMFGPGAGGLGGVVMGIITAFLKVALMVGLTFVVGERVIPWVLDRVAATRSRELFTLTVLVLALGIAVGSARLFGVSMALGAFLAGMVVGRSEFSLRAASDALPMRDAFAVLFFVSIGMLFDPAHLTSHPGPVVAALLVILIAKPAITMALLLRFSYPLRTSLAVAASTAQIGEFSFILAAAGKGLGLVDDRVTSTLVAAAIVSITLTPLLYRLIDRLDILLHRHAGPSRLEVPAAEMTDEATAAPRAVVVGHGPIGQTLCQLLREHGVQPVVIELNLETVRRLVSKGQAAIYGDARHAETLRNAGVENAEALILSAPPSNRVAETIRQARELNANLQIIARAAYVRQADSLRRAGANAVFSEEEEVALAMSEFLLLRLGVAAEQIERQRERVRREITTDKSTVGS
jgi:CPA2 family monovalent cation:H+ antiporter-2